MRRLLSAGLGLLLLGMAGVSGQNPDRSSNTARPTAPKNVTAGPTSGAVTPAPAPRPTRASALIGSQVSLRGGDALGKVTDIVIGQDGWVDYLVVSYRGNLLAVPWGAVRQAPGERVLTTNRAVGRDRLRDVTFREKEWPDFYSDRWVRTARVVWGEQVVPGPPPAMQQPRNPLPPPRVGERPPRRATPDLPGGTGHTEDRRPPG